MLYICHHSGVSPRTFCPACVYGDKVMKKMRTDSLLGCPNM